MTTVDLSWKLRAQKAEAALEVAQKENEGLSRDYQYLMKERDDAKEELEHVLDDWNALVKASGSRTNGAAIGHVAQMRAELEVKEVALRIANEVAAAIGRKNELLIQTIESLRSQGASPWIEAAEEIFGLAVEAEHGRGPEFGVVTIAAIIRKHAPVEGAGQWEAGRDAAAQYMEQATCKEGFYATQIRKLQPPAGLASPPEGQV